jgi:L-threonylcarbamoyladenylate synthase
VITAQQAQAFERCLRDGGVAVFPADTVYGLACDPEQPAAVERLYALKGRPPDKPAAVLFFALDRALDALPELEGRMRRAVEQLLPGQVTVLLPNPRRRFALACGPDRETLGLRVPVMSGDSSALGAVAGAVLQSSANLAGGADARRLDEVPVAVREGADLVLDGGELPGTPSTVVDLRELPATGRWSVAREGAVGADEIARRLG